jgi:hypothetical protein
LRSIGREKKGKEGKNINDEKGLSLSLILSVFVEIALPI